MTNCYLRLKLQLLLTMINSDLSLRVPLKKEHTCISDIYTYIYIYIYIYIYLYIYIYICNHKTMCPPSYHHNDFVAPHALGHRMHELPQSNCSDNKEAILFS